MQYTYNYVHQSYNVSQLYNMLRLQYR